MCNDPTGLVPVVKEVEWRRTQPPLNVVLNRRKAGGRKEVSENEMDKKCAKSFSEEPRLNPEHHIREETQRDWGKVAAF